MWIKADFLDDNGEPATGLIPTIRIRNLLTDTLVITDAPMTEVGDGTYKYNFTGYNANTDYSIRCDGGTSLRNRYAYGASFQDLEPKIDYLTAIEGGDWVLSSPNILTFYEAGGYPDPSKIKSQWACYDANGNPATENIVRAIRTL